MKNTESFPAKRWCINPELCIYCGKCELQFVANWIACERCNGWVHQVCISDQETAFDDFICKFCATAIQESQTQDVSDVNEVLSSDTTDKFTQTCYCYFDKNYRKSEAKIIEIERATRDQRLSQTCSRKDTNVLLLLILEEFITAKLIKA